MNSRLSIFALSLSLLAMGACVLPAWATNRDVGDIALVEDIDGSILQSAAAPNVYLGMAACAFYMTHPDRFDAVFIFDVEQLGIANVQQGWPVNSPSKGIGRGYPSQAADYFCSRDDRLRQAVKMGTIDVLPEDTEARACIDWPLCLYPLTGIELMGHEFGHQWLAAVTYQKEGQDVACNIRGYEPNGSGSDIGNEDTCSGGNINDFNQHWSYYMDSRSLMYGMFIEEQQDGSFHFWYEKPKYSQLDQYLMGLRKAQEVAPFFLVTNGDDDLTGSSSLPILRAADNPIVHEGTRVDVTIDDVIRSMGPRDPELEPCHWKGAFIILHQTGKEPTAAQIEKVDRYRRRWEEFYSWATDGRGSFDTTLDGCGNGTAGCPGTVEVGCDEPPCQSGLQRCRGSKRSEFCHNQEWVELEVCESYQLCIDGACMGTPPVVDGDADWPELDEESEESGEVAAEGEEFGIEEEGESTGNGVCVAEELRCAGDVVERCSADGSQWLEGTDCSLVGKTCVGSEGCVDPSLLENGDGSGCASVPAGHSGMLLLLLVVFLRVRRQVLFFSPSR